MKPTDTGSHCAVTSRNKEGGGHHNSTRIMVYVKLPFSPGLTRKIWKKGLVTLANFLYVLGQYIYGYIVDDGITEYANSPCQGATIVEGYVNILIPRLPLCSNEI